jgi:hypothetical protein
LITAKPRISVVNTGKIQSTYLLSAHNHTKTNEIAFRYVKFELHAVLISSKFVRLLLWPCIANSVVTWPRYSAKSGRCATIFILFILL